MINFRVANLDRMIAQLRAKGIEVSLDPEIYPYGRFARLTDPEGNPIEQAGSAERRPTSENFRGEALVGRDSVEPLSLSQSLMEPVGFYQRDTGRTVVSAHDHGVIPGGERSDDS